MTEPRKRNPAWRDNTRAARQRKRQAVLNQAAIDAGFESWSQLETAVINGATVTINAKEVLAALADYIQYFSEPRMWISTEAYSMEGERKYVAMHNALKNFQHPPKTEKGEQ